MAASSAVGEEDLEVSEEVSAAILNCWPPPGGRLAKLVAKIPISFKDDALESRFRKQNGDHIAKSFVRAGSLIALFVTVGNLGAILNIGIAEMGSMVNIAYICQAAIPQLVVAGCLLFLRIPESCASLVLSVAATYTTLMPSKRRFAYFYLRTDADTVFGGQPDFSVNSDAMNLTNLSIAMLAYFMMIPIRSKLSLVVPVVVPTIYLALTLPVEGLEGRSARAIGLSIRLLMLCLVGLRGRLHMETRERLLFFQLNSTREAMIQEKVLRFEAEHVAEQRGTSRQQRNSEDEVSIAAKSAALSSIIFTPPGEMDLQLRLEAMKHMAEIENWLVQAEDLKWEPASILGKGGFGIVMRGTYAGGDVAVKMPSKTELVTSRDLTLAAGAELRTLRRLRHPCVVSFYGATIDVANRQILLVEELINGYSLKEHVTENDISSNMRWHFLCQLVSTLRYLHGQTPPIMHNDVKPSNIMIPAGGATLKLIDFGLSLRVKEGNTAGGGSIRYMAPERFLGEVSCSCDIFSFGRLTYFLATNQDPLSEFTREEITAMAKEHRFPDLLWANDCSESFTTCCQSLLKECTLSDARQRPDCTAVLEILQTWPFEVTSPVQL